MRCPECDGELSEDLVRCPFCGHKFEDMVGEDVEKSDKNEDWWESFFQSVIGSLEFSDEIKEKAVEILSEIRKYKPSFFDKKGLMREVPVALYFAHMMVEESRTLYKRVTKPLGFSSDMMNDSIERWVQEDILDIIGLDVICPYYSISDEERKYLRKHYDEMTTEEINKKIKRGSASLINMASDMGLKDRVYGYNKKQEEFIREFYGYWDTNVIAELLDRSTRSIYSKTTRMGLSIKDGGKSGNWSEEETEFLRENYHEMTASEISDEIGRSESGVYQKARRMGLQKHQ